jgi:peptidoglycan-associated lipoprotein
MPRTILPLMASLLLLTLAGCVTAPQQETTRTDDTADEEETETAGDSDAGEAAETDGAGDDTGVETSTAAECPPDCTFARDALQDASGILSDRTIYFDFDSSNVQQEYMKIVKRHAAYLAQYPDVSVRLEGHTDERGSREYNVGLGERRADSVNSLLQAYGVAQDQIETVSYGEEIPAEQGSNEQAWSQNRRVELVYPASSSSGSSN